MIEKPGREPQGADLPFPCRLFPAIILPGAVQFFEAISSSTGIGGGTKSKLIPLCWPEVRITLICQTRLHDLLI